MHRMILNETSYFGACCRESIAIEAKRNLPVSFGNTFAPSHAVHYHGHRESPPSRTLKDGASFLPSGEYSSTRVRNF